jgi:hypothetical protein
MFVPFPERWIKPNCSDTLDLRNHRATSPEPVRGTLGVGQGAEKKMAFSISWRATLKMQPTPARKAGREARGKNRRTHTGISAHAPEL